MINKQQLINGLAAYIKQFILPYTSDIWSKRIMGGFADLLQMRPDMLDKYEVLKLVESEGLYDIDLLEELLLKNIDEYGTITITILGGSYTFNKNDIANLRGLL